mmetsp:Transcript_14422/g.31873  ORF Transcript_14422/g.31873 Transcript_14422/m.31873 type:complete len:242 (+) Transcript_14422:811-1536(+)
MMICRVTSLGQIAVASISWGKWWTRDSVGRATCTRPLECSQQGIASRPMTQTSKGGLCSFRYFAVSTTRGAREDIPCCFRSGPTTWAWSPSTAPGIARETCGARLGAQTRRPWCRVSAGAPRPPATSGGTTGRRTRPPCVVRSTKMARSLLLSSPRMILCTTRRVSIRRCPSPRRRSGSRWTTLSWLWDGARTRGSSTGPSRTLGVTPGVRPASSAWLVEETTQQLSLWLSELTWLRIREA